MQCPETPEEGSTSKDVNDIIQVGLTIDFSKLKKKDRQEGEDTGVNVYMIRTRSFVTAKKKFPYKRGGQDQMKSLQIRIR